MMMSFYFDYSLTKCSEDNRNGVETPEEVW